MIGGRVRRCGRGIRSSTLVTAPFKAAAGWAWDTVIGGITDWLAKGFVQLVVVRVGGDGSVELAAAGLGVVLAARRARRT